jgi:hypothetical protein
MPRTLAGGTVMDIDNPIGRAAHCESWISSRQLWLG